MQIKIERAKDVKGSSIRKWHDKTSIESPKTKEAVGAALRGVKQGMLMPEMQASNREEAMANARAMLRNLDGSTDEATINEVVNTVYDLLDDGLKNQSRELPEKTRKRITKAFSALPVLGYLIYAVTTGDFTFDTLLRLLGVSL